MIKKLITENFGFIRWLFTWLILVGMVGAGYYLVPIMLEQPSGSTGEHGLAFVLPLAPLTLITMAGSGLIALIWQFRIVGKED